MGVKIPKIVWDLIFTLAIPVSLLSPDLFKTGFSFSDRFGTVPTYVAAALIPAIYILVDTARTKVINPITIMAASSALIGGALAFLQVSGWQFALKDSYAHIVIALVMLGSLIIKRPFLGEFLKVLVNPETAGQKELYAKYHQNPSVHKYITIGTVIILVEAVLNASINFAVNLKIVTEMFGTKEFNKQVADANLVMRPISMVSNLIAYGLAFYVVSWASKNEYGDKVSPLEDHFWDNLAKSITPSEVKTFQPEIGVLPLALGVGILQSEAAASQPEGATLQTESEIGTSQVETPQPEVGMLPPEPANQV